MNGTRALVAVLLVTIPSGGCATASLVLGNDQDGATSSDVVGGDAAQSDGGTPGDGAHDPVFRALQIAVGRSHGCAVGTDSLAYCWGSNAYGQLGNGIMGNPSPSPVAVTGGLGTVAEVGAGSDHSCARTSTGTLWCWGWNFSNEVSPSAQSQVLQATRVAGVDSVAELALGLNSTTWRTSQGTVMGFGDDEYGQLGQGTTGTGPRTTPVTVSLPQGLTHVFAGGATGCAVGQVGSASPPTWWASCWGSLGGVGNATLFGPQPSPMTVPGPAETPSGWQQFAMSDDDGDLCGLTAAGNMQCAGLNGSGEFGNGSTDRRDQLGMVPGFANLHQIGVGNGFLCGVNSNDDVLCAGLNDMGQLGDGQSDSPTGPVTVVGVAHVQQLAVSGTQACVVAQDHSVTCWGNGNALPSVIMW